MGESSETLLCPWLLYSHGIYCKNNAFCNVACSPAQSSSIPHLNNKTILGSSHGWLILKKNRTDCKSLTRDFYYLWNPITLKSIHFPPFNSKPGQSIVSFILSSSPDDDSNSMLLLFEAAIPAVFVCRLFDPEWIELRYVNFYHQWGEAVTGHLHSPISYNGNVFAIGNNRDLCRVEVKFDNTIFIQSLIHLPLIPVPRSNFLVDNLVECCGELYIVYCIPGDVQYSSTRSIVAVHVFKLNFSGSGMIWEKMDNIHNHAFFLSFHIAISCPASTLSSFPSLRNRIYFTMREDECKTLFSYHVEDGTLTMCPQCPDLPTPSSFPLWVTLPTHGTNIGEQKEETLKALAFAEERKDIKENVFPWTDLPMELQKLISEKLPPFDYMNFRSICRMNRLVAPPIQWRTKLEGLDHQPDQLHSLSPCLIYSPAGKNVCNFLHPYLNGRYLVMTPEPFQDPIVHCCKEGWLLMSESRNLKDYLLSMFLFNPFTKATIQLPCMEEVDWSFDASRFSLLPYSSDCCYAVYFQNTCNAGTRVKFLVTYRGSDQWYSLSFLGTEKLHPVDNAPVFLNNSIYYLGEDGKLGVLTRTEQEPGWRWDVLNVEGRPDDFRYSYLVECDGQLLSVFVGDSGKWVKVFMLCEDDSPTINWWWEPVDDLRKHVLYLSRLSTFSKVAQVEGTKNRIYFERLYRERVIFYSLNTKEFHASDYKDSGDSYYNTSEPLLCAWIEPNWGDKLPQPGPWIQPRWS